MGNNSELKWMKDHYWNGKNLNKKYKVGVGFITEIPMRPRGKSGRPPQKPVVGIKIRKTF